MFDFPAEVDLLTIEVSVESIVKLARFFAYPPPPPPPLLLFFCVDEAEEFEEEEITGSDDSATSGVGEDLFRPGLLGGRLLMSL